MIFVLPSESCCAILRIFLKCDHLMKATIRGV